MPLAILIAPGKIAADWNELPVLAVVATKAAMATGTDEHQHDGREPDGMAEADPAHWFLASHRNAWVAFRFCAAKLFWTVTSKR